MSREISIIYYSNTIEQLEIDIELLKTTEQLITKYGEEIASDISEILGKNWPIDKLVEQAKSETTDSYRSLIMLNGEDSTLHFVINSKRIEN